MTALHHRSVAGNWLFSGRRWRNPAAASDRAALSAGYNDLVAAFPAFSCCPRDRFLKIIGETCASWSRRIGESTTQSAASQRSSSRAFWLRRSGERAIPPAPAQSPCSPPLHASSSAAVAAVWSVGWTVGGDADQRPQSESDTGIFSHNQLVGVPREFSQQVVMHITYHCLTLFIDHCLSNAMMD